jgi:hypothetical protein
MPATVCTVTPEYPVMDMYQRKLFYAKGLFWLFYETENNSRFRTSSNGIDWSDATLINPVWSLAAESFSVVYDGEDYMHIACAQGTQIYYRRGKLGSDGTITWDEWQNAGLSVSYRPTITLDSNGYPWIGAAYKIDTVLYPYITKSSTKDGTWTTDSGFPYELSSILTGDNTYVIPVALTGGKVYAIYSSGYLAKVYGKLYDGAWGAEEEASSSTTGKDITATSYIDEVHVAFTSSTYKLCYIERDSAGSWSGEKELYSADETFYGSICVDVDNGDLYVFWAFDGVMYLIRKMAGIWDSNYTKCITGEGSFLGNKVTRINSFIKKYGRCIAVAWARGASSPYDLRCAVLTILPSSLKSNSHNL